jgi:hypothetical protein
MVQENLKIEIRPIPKEGRDIKQFSENLEYFSQPHTVPPLVNPVTRKYDTGLTEEDIAYLEKEGFPYDFKDDRYVPGQAHPFWESSIVKTELPNTPIFLHPGRSLIEFVKWKYLSVSPYVYASEEDLKTGTKSEATHYIYNEEVETELKASKIEERDKLMRKVSNLSLERKRNLVLILLNEVVTNKKESYITIKLDEILKDESNTNNKKEKLMELLSQSKEDVSLLADVKLAIQKGVLRKTKAGIFYFENNLGMFEEDVVSFLKSEEGNEILISIKSKIE